MFTFDRTFLLKAYLCIALLGLSMGKLAAWKALQGFNSDSYGKIWNQHKKKKKKKKHKKKKREKKGRLVIQLIAGILKDYSGFIVAGCVCLFFGYVLLSPNKKVRPTIKKDSPTHIIDIKDPIHIARINKSKISEEVLKKTVERAWKHPPFKKFKKNTHDDFEGHDGITNMLAKQVQKFDKDKKKGKYTNIWDDHYDWWVFGNPHNSRGGGMKYAVYRDDIEALKEYKYNGDIEAYRGWTYVKLQRRAANLILESMGWWNSDTQQITGRCKRIHSGDRMGKMLHGLLLLNPALYKVANALILELEKRNYHLKDSYKQYITRELTE